MSKKSFVSGIFLVVLSGYIAIGLANSPPADPSFHLFLILVIVLPILIGGLILLLKYFRSRKTISQKEKYTDYSKKNKDSDYSNNTKDSDKTQFWN